MDNKTEVAINNETNRLVELDNTIKHLEIEIKNLTEKYENDLAILKDRLSNVMASRISGQIYVDELKKWQK